jgi:general secretion pathway protein M
MRLLPESARSQRIFAIGLLLIALLLAYLLFVHWWLVSPYMEMRDQYYDLRDQQYHFAELIQSKPQIEKQLKEVAGLEQQNQAFLNDADAASAFSDLSERLKRAVEENHDPNARCIVNGISPAGNPAPEVYLRVSANVNLSCQAETFAKVLYSLETSNPYLFVDRLVIYRQQAMFTPGGKAPPGATLVNAQFNLSGFLRQPGGQQPGNAKGVK